ncbi:MAG TPA: NAD(P)-binding domain-containing protein, partial [Streptomyces sp.]|nr:NAD(P)-binding domain-containing protein [Streptomyces sp.]
MTSHPISVAVLGTGIMGAAMARSLLRAGLRVSAWNRTPERARPLVGDGARVTGTAAEAVDGADVVLTMVHDGPAVLDALRAAAPGPRPGTIWLQCTTVGLDSLPLLAGLARERGLVLVDAPVLGTRAPAEEGKLTVLAAGPPDVRERL